jgi:DNA gyrase/topoisomerase IV subunit B
MSDLHIIEEAAVAVVRRRPGMYIGDTRDGSGLQHMLWELVANSIDEHISGHAHRLSITLHADQSVTIEDDGRGIPVEMHASARPCVEVALTEFHGTGTFDGHTKHVHLGLHGLGMVVVNAVSSSLVVEIARGGSLYRQTYQAGVPTAPLAVVGATTKTGTRITFAPDPTIFSATAMDGGAVRERLREVACFNPRLVLHFVDERTELSEPRGIVGLAERLFRGCGTTPAAPLYVRGERGHIGVRA